MICVFRSNRERITEPGGSPEAAAIIPSKNIKIPRPVVCVANGGSWEEEAGNSLPSLIGSHWASL